jgi:hypothetical protein
MKSIRLLVPAFLITSVAAVLVACGGSDDESGGPVAFNVVPEQFGYQSAAGSASCAAGSFGDRFLINGGTAPYTVESTSPNIVVPSTNRVNDRGGSFEVTFTGFCTTEEGVTILVKDALNRQVTVKVTNVIQDS